MALDNYLDKMAEARVVQAVDREGAVEVRAVAVLEVEEGEECSRDVAGLDVKP